MVDSSTIGSYLGSALRGEYGVIYRSFTWEREMPALANGA